MDFDNLNADVNMILDKHFTHGRKDKYGNDNEVQFVVLHYNAGDLTVEGCHNVWQTREASAHYQVESSGRVGQLVWDRDTAWHAGDGNANRKSIGIEHANQGDTITDACLESGSHLVAAICKEYGLGRPEWMVNVFPHCHFCATSCPGPLKEGTSYHDRYMQRAGEWYDAMCGGSTPAPQPSTSGNSVDLNALADAVMRGEYGNGDQRRAALGSNYDAVQAIVNERCGVSSGSSSTTSVDIDDLARRVIAGEFGNGDSRRAALGSNYDAVQARVNEMLGGGSSTTSVDIDDLARRVIAGEFGNGADRKAALGSNYDAVQARVNQMLS